MTRLSSNPPATTPQKAGGRWRRVWRRAGIALIGLLVLALVVFFLLPVWISNEQGRTYILQRLNRQLSGSSPNPLFISIDEWSLGWFRGTKLRNLRVKTADGRALLTCPEIDSGMTLWDLVWGNYDLRTTTADGMQLVILKYPDGRTSWNELAGASAGTLRSLRGALQINGGGVTIQSIRSGESIHYDDLKASLTIASAESPFHVQLSAVGITGEEAPPPAAEVAKLSAGRTRDVSINATFPAIRDLIRTAQAPGTAPAQALWPLVGDVEFSASNVPSELACDCFGLEPGWSESLGQVIESVRFSNHGSLAQDLSRPSLAVRGRGLRKGVPFETQIDARVQLRAPDESGGNGLLLLPSGSAEESDPLQCEAAVRMSPNLAGLLKRINPLLGEAREGEPSAGVRGGGDMLCRISIQSLTIPLDEALAKAQATGRITFPPLAFADSGASRSIVGQLRAVTSQDPSRLEGSAAPLRIRLAEGSWDYQNFVVTFGRATLIFTGTVNLDGAVNLVARIPGMAPADPSGELGSGSMQISIAGTTDAPIVQRAQ